MAEIQTNKRQVKDALGVLSGQISETKQELSAKIDSVQASLGTQLQELLDFVHRGDAKKGKNREDNKKRSGEEMRWEGGRQKNPKRKGKAEEALGLGKFMFLYV